MIEAIRRAQLLNHWPRIVAWMVLVAALGGTAYVSQRGHLHMPDLSELSTRLSVQPISALVERPHVTSSAERIAHRYENATGLPGLTVGPQTGSERLLPIIRTSRLQTLDAIHASDTALATQRAYQLIADLWEIDSDFVYELSEVDLSDPADPVIVCDAGWVVRLGAGNLSDKLTRLHMVLDEAQRRGAQPTSIDLRDQHAVSLRLRTPSKESRS